MSPAIHKRLSDILMEQELLDTSQLAQALAEQKKSGLPLSRILVEMDLVSEEDIVVALSEQLGIPHIRVDNYNIPPEVIEDVPETLARQYVLIPISKTGDTLTVAMADPLNIMALDDLKMFTGRNIEVMVSLASEINSAIYKYYGEGTENAEQAIYDTLEGGGDGEELEVVSEEEIDLGKLREEAEDTPIIQLANLILVNAIEAGASDIHVEPFDKELRIRYRVDGILTEVKSPPKSVQAALTSRLKIMSELDIAEHRLPQDGRFRIRYKGREIDFRVSSLPTYHGEKVVIRILDKEQLSLDIETLGFEEQPVEVFLQAIKNPYGGLILLSGPTGSGKTTTLYATLHRLNSPDVNIVTVEDPIEYELFGVNQVQAHSDIGLTFASGLRSILRQDPDVVMVGEMRDDETADIAIKAALTGHLVLSTVHANDGPSVVTRMLDMGMEPFLVASSLVASAAQRLMRRICPDCKEEFEPPPEALEEIQYEGRSGEAPTFSKGRGCNKCNSTGYRGRLAVIEAMLNTKEIEDLIVERASATELKRAAVKLGMRTLRQNALAKAAKGLTTIDEVLRVTTAD
jgi:type IV pilus assembly protein PilB